MTEREKMIQGLPYWAGDPELVSQRMVCKDLCFAYNQLLPSHRTERHDLIQ